MIIQRPFYKLTRTRLINPATPGLYQGTASSRAVRVPLACGFSRWKRRKQRLQPTSCLAACGTARSRALVQTARPTIYETSPNTFNILQAQQLTRFLVFSLVDATNVVLMEKYRIDFIFSFDALYDEITVQRGYNPRPIQRLGA